MGHQSLALHLARWADGHVPGLDLMKWRGVDFLSVSNPIRAKAVVHNHLLRPSRLDVFLEPYYSVLLLLDQTIIAGRGVEDEEGAGRILRLRIDQNVVIRLEFSG